MRLGSMGDIIHTLPAVTALRQAFPEATLGWIVEERWAELLCTLPEPRSGPRSPRRPLVDRVHTVNTKSWRKSLLSMQTWEQIAAGLSELRAQRYEVAVDFQGAVRSALLARWSGAPVIYGVRTASRKCCQHVLHASGDCPRQPHCGAESVARGGRCAPSVGNAKDRIPAQPCCRKTM